jgi:nicotinate dehydrogenase subunit B
VAFRRLLVERAAARLSVGPGQVELDAEGAACRSAGSRVSYGELAVEGPITGMVEPTDQPQWDTAALGQPVPRDDLRPKLTGAPAYAQDLTLPGMLYARALLPPTYDSRPEHLAVAGARQMPGVQHVLHDGRLVVVIAESEHQAMRAVSRLGRDVRWRRDGPPLAATGPDVQSLLRPLPSQPFVARHDPAIYPDLDQAQASARTCHRATFTKPYEAHGPMGPSAAVALDDGDRLHIWSHTQGVYPLRRELAALLQLAEDRIVVEHVDGPGCYGMDGADDAAALAAIAARATPGRPVRFQLSMEDELSWDPYGPAMLADLDASLDADGRIVTWRHHAVTDAHGPRPDGTGDRLLASWLQAGGVTRPWAGPGEPGARNAVPPYDIPAVDVVAHHVRGPLRTGPLRSLGSYLNVFAAESFVDELAERAGQDPLAFRLAHLTDSRARRVLQVAAERAGWEPHVGPSGRGLGLAFARYKDTKAYAAQVAEVDVDVETGEITVRRMVVAADAGTIVNADGLRNQLEGGTIQGLSRAMHEQVGFGDDGVTTRDWTTYPVLRFRHVPRIEVVMVDRPGSPPLGAGESATPPVPAALANAIDDAVGIRLRDLPLTPARLRQRLYDMDEDEAQRVRL